MVDFFSFRNSEVSAISNSEIEAIKKFVNNGGRVIADYELAILDELCNKRGTPALNEMLGVNIKRISFMKPRKKNVLSVSPSGRAANTLPVGRLGSKVQGVV